MTKESKGYTVIDVLLTAYLMNVFYFKEFAAIQKLIVWGIILMGLLKNLNSISDFFNSEEFRNNSASVITMFVFWGIIAGITPFFHGTMDFSFCSVLFSMIANILSLLLILSRLVRRGSKRPLIELFMEVYILGMCVYVLSTVIALVIPQYRAFIINHVDMSDYNKNLIIRKDYYTRIGFAGLSVYNAGIKCVLANAFTLYFLLKRIVEHKKTIGMIALYLVTILGICFYARTSLIVSVLLLIVFLWYLLFVVDKLNVFVKYAFCIFGIILIIYFILIQYDGDNKSFSWMFEPIINLINGRGFSATSLNIMKRMEKMPSILTWIIGDGYFQLDNGGYYMGVDLGYLRMIFYYGLIGTIMMCLLQILTSFTIRKNNRTPETSLLSWLLLVIFFVEEIKGEAMGVTLPVVMILSIASTYKAAVNNESEQSI